MDSSKPTHQVTQDPCESVPSEYTLFTMPSQQTRPLQMDIEVEGHNFSMEIDTGAEVSIVNEKTRTSLSHLQN